MVRRGVYNVYIVHYNSKPMTKTRIIGHRGAAGLELENTMPSFEQAILSGARIIEFDVRTTLDNYLVISHDDNLERTSSQNKSIRELTLTELQAVALKNGSTVPRLTEVLELARKHKVAVIIELKAINDPAGLCNTLDAFTDLKITITSFNHGLLAEIKKLRPKLRMYLGEMHRPIAVLHEARTLKAQGIDLQYMLMNPLTYLIARAWKLDIMLYTVNNRFIARFLMMLYPHAYICTNYPNQLLAKDSRR